MGTYKHLPHGVGRWSGHLILGERGMKPQTYDTGKKERELKSTKRERETRGAARSNEIKKVSLSGERKSPFGSLPKSLPQ